METKILSIALGFEAVDGLADDFGRDFNFTEALHQSRDSEIVDPFGRQLQFQGDPLTEIDIPNLMRETGDALEATDKTDSVIAFRIRKNG